MGAKVSAPPAHVFDMRPQSKMALFVKFVDFWVINLCRGRLMVGHTVKIDFGSITHFTNPC